MKKSTSRALFLTFSSLALVACAGSGNELFDSPHPEVGDDWLADPSALPPTIGEEPPRPGTTALPTVFATKQEAAQNLMLLGDSLYWIDFNGTLPKLQWVHTDGGDWQTVRDLESLPFDTATDEAGLYLSASSQQHILFASELGLEPAPLHSSLTDPLALEVDEDHAYWTSVGGCVNRGAKEGGDAEVVACGEGAAVSLALAGDFVFWATLEGNIYRAPKGVDTEAEKIAAGESFASGIIADETRIYWGNTQTRQVRSLTYSTGLIDVLANGQYEPAGITQDRFHIYFSTQGDGAIKRISKQGGLTTVLATEQGAPGELVVGDEYLFWVDEASGNIMRHVKP
jgi:hypothetical protein